MAPVQFAVVTYAPTRNCFLIVPKDFIKDRIAFQDIPVLQIEYGPNKKAYFSCKSDFSVSSIQLNAKYASVLGIRDQEQVQTVHLSQTLPHVERLSLEPLNSDDWELLHLNAQKIEVELLHQVRIVWKNQVFPIWVNQTSLYVQVAEVFPDSEPALLGEWTEILVKPKERDSLKSPDSSQFSPRERRSQIYSQYGHLRKRGKKSKSPNSSAMSTFDDSDFGSQSSDSQVIINSSFRSFWRRFIVGNLVQHGLNSSPSSLPSELDDFQPLNLDFSLRVISYSKSKGNHSSSSLPLALQATTVFISESTFLKHCGGDFSPDCFVAYLSKLLTPLHKKHLADSEAHDTKSLKEKPKKQNSVDGDEQSQMFKYVCVNVVVLKPGDADFDVPVALFLSSDFICVPLELKKRLGLELTSRVRVQSANSPPSYFNTILLYPLENLHVNGNDSSVSQEFSNWIKEANLEDTSIVLCDGTVAKLNLSKGRTCDFVVALVHLENGDKHSSFSSSSDSPSSLSGLELDKSSNESKLPNYSFLNSLKLKMTTVKLGSMSPRVKKHIWGAGSHYHKVETLYQSLPVLSMDALGGITRMMNMAMSNFDSWFRLRPMPSMGTHHFSAECGSMLIHGPKGVGKSTFVQSLCKHYINFPHFVYIFIVKCLPLRGKRVETISRHWKTALAECIYHQPSVLVFEDLDHLASAPSTPEQEAGADGLYFGSIAEVLLSLHDKIIVHGHNVVLVCTSRSIHSLHAKLTQTKGSRLFQTILELRAPDLKQRQEILMSLVMSRDHLSTESIKDEKWTEIATKTEGYVAQDLCVLIDKAIHSAWLRTRHETSSDVIQLIHEDFDFALSSYTPASLRGLQLQKDSHKTWKNVGGLQDVKSLIQQTLTWPVKYKSLYKNCTLRPQRSILLYGAPGTGKTLIAGAVAGECGMNFISIKGPELLSKYIGASEQAVRDLFMRAMSAKPCILFFDEFDALAPRRGHDSTGVTDRVVNQLLTQIDGVEDMNGVYILAATSRPELIDPALLRPGRLDKCIHCPLPNEKERQEILEALSVRLTLSDDVNFSKISEMTEHFSGADLQALLYSAQVKSVHEDRSKKRSYSTCSDDVNSDEVSDDIIHMSSIEDGISMPSAEETRKMIHELETVLHDMNICEIRSASRHRRRSTISSVIEEKHMLQVLDEMKPSVSAEERMKYQLIYQKFHDTRGTDFATNTEAQRVTLA